MWSINRNGILCPFRSHLTSRYIGKKPARIATGIQTTAIQVYRRYSRYLLMATTPRMISSLVSPRCPFLMGSLKINRPRSSCRWKGRFEESNSKIDSNVCSPKKRPKTSTNHRCHTRRDRYWSKRTLSLRWSPKSKLTKWSTSRTRINLKFANKFLYLRCLISSKLSKTHQVCSARTSRGTCKRNIWGGASRTNQTLKVKRFWSQRCLMTTLTLPCPLWVTTYKI